MTLEFSGEIWFWRGPSPYHFVTIPEDLGREIKAISGFVTYGWGVIPVNVQIGKTLFKTSLFPKNGSYIVPIKDKVRQAENLDIGDNVKIWLKVG